MLRNLSILLFICMMAAGYYLHSQFTTRYVHEPNVPSTAQYVYEPNIPSNATSKVTVAGNRMESPYSILNIRNLLLQRDFQKLNTVLDEYHRSYLSDVNTEDDLFNAYYRGFSLTDAKYEKLLDAWIENFPDIYQPYLARATYNYFKGWDARGAKFASETSANQVTNMQYYFSKASNDIDFVLNKQQDHIIPYFLLINIYKALGTKTELQTLAQRALENCPGSFRIRSTYLLAISPRWGGSYEAMEQFAEDSQHYVSINPRVKLLSGYVYYDAGDMQKIANNYGEALSLLDKAINYGDLDLFYEDRAKVLQKLEKYDEALADINAAIELNPQNFDLYYRKANILGDLERLQECLDNILIAEQLKPGDENTLELKKWLANRYYSKAHEYIDKNDYTAARPEVDKAIEIAPDQRDYYRLMDWLLAKQSAWDEIIGYWNRYLNINPNDDVAYLERGGAYFHKGDLASAVADAKRAADLGNADGQKMYERHKNQITR